MAPTGALGATGRQDKARCEPDWNGTGEPDDKGHRKEDRHCLSSSMTRLAFRNPRS